MNFNDTEQQAQFRAKCSAWLKNNAQLTSQTSNHNPHGKAGSPEFLDASRIWQKRSLTLVGQCCTGQKFMVA